MAEKKDTGKGQSAAHQRPKTSPYINFPAAIYIGQQRRQFYVPQALLQNQDWIASSRSSAGGAHGVFLPDVDEGTGHVLVHYLFTGTYQTLDDMETSTVGKANIGFKRAFLAYIAAKKYGLNGLRKLAQLEIKQLGTEMNIFDTVEAIKEDFSRIPGDTIWIQRIDSVALAKMLAKCVVQLYNKKLPRMLDTQVSSMEEAPGPEHPPPECSTGICPVQTHPVQETSTEVFVTGDQPSHLIFDTFNAAPKKSTPVTDEIALEADGWASFLMLSKKKRDMKGNKCVVEDSSPVPSPPEQQPELELQPVVDDLTIVDEADDAEPKLEEQLAIAEDEICFARAKLLPEGDK